MPKIISHESSSSSSSSSGGPRTVIGEFEEVGTGTTLVHVPATNVTDEAVDGMIGLGSMTGGSKVKYGGV